MSNFGLSGRKDLEAGLCISAQPGEITGGLFGTVFLYIFEILPYLQRRRIYPRWSIASELYGASPEFLVVPGLLDLAYDAPEIIYRTVGLSELREGHPTLLGDDWHNLNALWSAYFRVPERIATAVGSLGDLSATLGVHYRGTDKSTAAWDTNPVKHEEFVLIIKDMLQRRPELKRIFVATDEASFISYLMNNIDVTVTGFGAGRHHFLEKTQTERTGEADRPLTDCVALSHCAAVLNTSSALSGFSKILNPNLEIYRCAASKMFADVPYFPIAYIPPYRTEDAQLTELLRSTMANDWLSDGLTRQYGRGIAFKSRSPLKSFLRRLRRHANKLSAKFGFDNEEVR